MAQSPVTKSPPEGSEEEDMEGPQPGEDDPVVPHPAPSKDSLSSSPKRQQKGLLQKRSAPNLTVHMVSSGKGKKVPSAAEEDEEVGHMQVLSLSPGAESTPDSCYDSDGSGSGSQRSSGTRSELHADVSRTMSDTLVAEHTEVFTTATTTNLTSGETPMVPPEAPMPSEESEEVASEESRKVVSKAAKRSCSDDGSRETLVKQETQEFSLSPSGIDGPMTPDPEEDPPRRPSSPPSGGRAQEVDTTVQVAEGLQELMLDISNTEENEEAETGPDVGMEDEEDLDDDDDDDVDVDDELKAVRYGIRLGYSQELTQRVIDELGPDAGKDDLLQELIRHTEVQKDDDGEEEEAPIMCSWVPPLSADASSKDDGEAASDGKVQQLASQATGDVQAAGGKDIANLRPIIIDGSNIAMSHGNKQVFSCRGIRLAVDYFRERGHSKVTVFVPSWRKEASRQDTQIVDQELLYELEQEKTLVFTPSRWVSGKRIVCYDDLYIIKLAAEDDGIVVSNDNYRDLINKSPEYKRVIEERLLMYSFVNDRFMPPDDPLGRHGPSLDNFLSKHPVVPEPLPPACPYGKKCTYGNKCKYYHPERGTTPRKSVLEVLQEKERVEIAKVRPITKSREPSPADVASRDKSPTPSEPGKKAPPKTRSFASSPKSGLITKKALARTRSLATGAVGGTQVGTGTLPSPPVPFEPPSMQAKAMGDQQNTDGLNDDMQTSGTNTESTTTSAATGASTKNYFSKGSQDDEVREAELKHELFSRMTDRFSASCCQSLESLQLPTSWSKGLANDTLRQLKPLRTTFSDPQGDPYFELDCGHLSLAKKLSDEGNEEEQEKWQNALLSAVASGGTPMAVVSPHTSPGRQHPKAVQQPEEPKQNVKSSNGHRRLQRQLSLQGSEDPRLQPKGPGRGLNSGQGSPGVQKMKKDQKRHMTNTKFTFHSASGLAGPFPPHYSQENKVHMGNLSTTYTFSDQSEQQQHQHIQQQQHPQQQQHQQYGAMGQVYDMTDHNVVGRHASFSGGEKMQPEHHPLLRQQQSLQLPGGGEQQQQQSFRMSPGERIAACRMASAPGTYSYHKSSVNNSTLGPYWHSSSIMPTIHRQNSTSDPQLHTLQDNSSGLGDGSGARMLGVYNHQQMLRRGFGAQELGGNNAMMWAQSFEVPNGNRGGIKSISHLFDDHLDLPGSSMDERIPRCASFDSSLPSNRVNVGSSSFDGAIHLSGSYEELPSTAKSHSFEGTMSSSEIGQYSGGLDGGLEMSSMHSYYQQQQQQQQQHEISTGTHSPAHSRHYGTDNKPHGSDQSLFLPSRVHMNSLDTYHHAPPGSSLMAPRKSSPDIYNFLSQVQQPSPSQPTPPIQPQHPSTQQHQQQQQQQGLQQHDLFTGQMGHRLVNRISPVMMACGEGLLANTAPSPPHPDDQTPCSVPDTRRKLFYHLCGLFPEAEVREAMQRLPMETQPEKLLSYILGMRSLHTN